MPRPIRARKTASAATRPVKKPRYSLRPRSRGGNKPVVIRAKSKEQIAEDEEREKEKRARRLERNAKKRAARAKQKLDQEEAAATLLAQVTTTGDQNIYSSTLLGLPSEVRLRILAFAAGGHHIRIEHVRPPAYYYGNIKSSPWTDRPRTRRGGFWNHCYTDGDFSRVPEEGNDELRFRTPGRWGTDPAAVIAYRKGWPVSGQTYRAITRVCRQIYHEIAALQYPYRLNTFSFYDCDALTKWVNRLKRGQRNAVTRVVLPDGPESIWESTRVLLKGLTAVYMPKTYLAANTSEKGRWESHGIRVIEYESRSDVRAEVLPIE